MYDWWVYFTLVHVDVRFNKIKDVGLSCEKSPLRRQVYSQKGLELTLIRASAQ